MVVLKDKKENMEEIINVVVWEIFKSLKCFNLIVINDYYKNMGNIENMNIGELIEDIKKYID